jgi:hypothetical protein
MPKLVGASFPDWRDEFVDGKAFGFKIRPHQVANISPLVDGGRNKQANNPLLSL